MVAQICVCYTMKKIHKFCNKMSLDLEEGSGVLTEVLALEELQAVYAAGCRLLFFLMDATAA